MLALLAALSLAASTQKPVITVLYFDNFTNDPAYDVMRKGLADMIITDLVAWNGVTVVERERLESVLAELKLQQAKGFDPTTTAKVGKLLGASYSLVGSMMLDQRTGRLRVDAKLRDVARGTFVAEARAEAAPDALFELEQQLVEKLIAGLDATLTADPLARRKARVPNLEAVKLFSEALDLSDLGKLDEAQAAMRAVISKAPSFLLARERQQQLLAKFQDYEKRKHDLVTGSVLELAKRIDDVLASAKDLDQLPLEVANRALTMRLLKGRFIVRSAKQFFSSHDPFTRVAKRGLEAKALLAQRAWLENALTLREDLRRVGKRGPVVATLDATDQRLVADAQFGPVVLVDPFADMLDFVFDGVANDGERCVLLPALGAVDRAQRQAMLTELEARTAAAAHGEAFSLARQRAQIAVDDGEIDLAVSTMQKVLDAFPTDAQSPDFERRIKELLEGRGVDTRAERWAAGLKTCKDDMDFIVGLSAADRRWLVRGGLQAIDQQLAALDHACPKFANQQTLMGTFARLYAAHDDCEASTRMWKRYLAGHGSVRDLMGWSRQQPWCSVAAVLGEQAWLHSRLDENWDLEFSDELLSSGTSTELTISGVGWVGTPSGRRRQAITFTLRREGADWRCEDAAFAHHDGVTLKGTCSGAVTSSASKPGDFDEGTFRASFFDPREGVHHTTVLSDGVFRVKRK